MSGQTKTHLLTCFRIFLTAPDKRDLTSNLIAPPAPPKRLSHKRSTDWSTEDDPRNSNDLHDLRDSGISTLSSLSDFQSQLSNLNNLSYEDFEPRSRNNDTMNISPPSGISAMNTSTISFSSVNYPEVHPR
jgi:dedicator of cytokinesis protein 3